MATTGDAPQAIQSRAGHTDHTTTLGYIREAETLAAAFGNVFPSLPELATDWAKDRAKSRKTLPKCLKSLRGGRDSKALAASADLPISVVDVASSAEVESSSVATVRNISQLVDGGHVTDKIEPAVAEWWRGLRALLDAIASITRALATANDDAIADLVAERRAMRDELRAMWEREAGNVVDATHRFGKKVN